MAVKKFGKATFYKTFYIHHVQYLIIQYDKIQARNQNLEEGTSWMWDHLLEAHGPNPNINPVQDFSFNLFQTFKDPMSRQLSEAVRIQVALNQGKHQGKDGSSKPIVSLNRKNEFFCQRKRFGEAD